MAKRILLGKMSSPARNLRVYEAADALEIDDREDYDVRRRRLFYDEIELVTLHHRVRWGRGVGAGLLLVLLILAAIASWNAPPPEMYVLVGVAAALGLAALAMMLVALFVGMEVVTVYGARTWARMEFTFRKQAARDAYLRVCRLAREHQGPPARPARAVEPFEVPPPREAPASENVG
jgi:hypothetical protein